MILGIVAAGVFLVAYLLIGRPMLIYLKALRCFGKEGVMLVLEPRYTSIQLYEKMSRKDGDSMLFLRKKVQQKPEAKLLIVVFFFYSFIYVLDTDMIRSLSNEHIHSMTKKPFMFFKHMEKGLLFSKEIAWKKSRAILSNLFHFDVLKSREGIMNKVVDQATRDLEKSSVNLFDLGLEISGEITLQSFLGENFAQIRFGGKRVLGEIREIIDLLVEHSIQPWWIVRLGVTGMDSPPDWLLRKAEINLRERILRFKTLTREFLKAEHQRFRKGEKPSSNFIEAYYNQSVEGECIEEMIDQIFIFLVAGQDTTGMLIEASLFYLAEYPQYQQQILNEYASSPSDLHRGKVLNNFLNEVLRMRGPTRNTFIRSVQKPFEIKGFRFETHYLPVVAFGLVMMNPKHFDNPEDFTPERWEKPLEDKLSFTPFFSGPHNCIGQHMALMEARIALTSILSQYHLKRTPTPDRITQVSLLYKMQNHHMVQFLKK